MSSSSSPIVKVSVDGGKTYDDYVKKVDEATQEPPVEPTPEPAPMPGGAKSIALIMHANWLSSAEFDSIAKGNVNENDLLRYRCTKYPDGFDQKRWDYLKEYKKKTPGLKIGIDVGYSKIVVDNAKKFKELGCDFVEYNIEAAFDGPNSDSEAQNNVNKIKVASDAVHKEDMEFSVAPGKPNSTSFMRKGLLDDVAKLVEHYHIQAQSIQDTTSKAYADFTESVTKQIRAANSKLRVTSQISPHQGAQQGKTLQDTMRSCITEAMKRTPVGNTLGAGMWISGDEVDEAASFFSWFKKQWP